MQSTRDTIRQKRINKRRNPRKKSLSPSDLKCDAKIDFKTSNKRSLTEINVKHRKSNIRRKTHPLTSVDSGFDDVLSQVKLPGPMPESDESNLPPTSSDRDTEDDARAIPKFHEAVRSRWDSGSEMDSLVSIVVKRASARRRRVPDNSEWGVSSEAGEASEAEGGRMRPEDYRLVFVSSDSSCRDDTEDSSSTASSAAPPAPDDCDWDYFEPGTAGGATPLPPHLTNNSQNKAPTQPCPKTCSCGAEPRIVAVPVPVPVPFPAALWPALLAFQNPSATHHWSTYPGFPHFDAATFARITSAAAAAVTAATAAAALPQTKTIEMSSVEKTDKAIQSEASTSNNHHTINIDTDNALDKQSLPILDNSATSDNMLIVNDVKSFVDLQQNDEVIPDHLVAENAFNSTSNSAESSDSESGIKQQSYDVTSGAPEEPATSDEDSDDSGGGGGGSFTRVFVVNPDNSSSDLEDNADSSGIDCDDSYERQVELLDPVPEQLPNPNHIMEQENENNGVDCDNIVLLQSHDLSDNITVNSGLDDELKSNEGSMSRRASFMKFCDENMLNSETLKSYNSFSPPQQIKDENNYLEEIETEQPSLPTASNYELDQLSLNKKVCFGFGTNNSIIEKQSSKLNNQKESSPELSLKRSISPISQVTKNSHNSTVDIDLVKGIELKLSELLMKESLEECSEGDREVKPVSEPVLSARAPAPCARAERRPVPCELSPEADVDARFTSRVMITHDRERVSVVTSDTTRLMQHVTVHHTNLQDVPVSPSATSSLPAAVTVVNNPDTLSTVVCLEEGLADDDSWVEDVSHGEDAATTTDSDSDSGGEAALPARTADFGYCRRSLDFTLHTIVEESCEESDAEHVTKKKQRPISATELEKYFCYGLSDGRAVIDDGDQSSETSSVCSEGGSIIDNEPSEQKCDNDDLVSSRLEKYFLSGFMGFNQERRDSDGSGSVGSDSEGKQSPEQRRKRLVRARGTPRSHSSSLDNLLTGDEPSQDTQEHSDGSSTETEDRHDLSEKCEATSEQKRKKQSKKTRSPLADDRRLSTEYPDETRDDARSVSEGEDGKITPRPEFSPLGSELSECKKQTSRDSGFVGSCDDLLRNGDSSDFKSEPRTELEEIMEEIRPDIDERLDGIPQSQPPPMPLSRKDSFNNWSSDEETNLMMTKMRQFFKQMVASANVKTSTPTTTATTVNSESTKPPKPPQLLYFESELTRLMKTVPGIRDEEVREIVEYLSSEDTWSDSYDSSDYAGSDLESCVNKSVLRKQISESCREIIDEFDRGSCVGGSLERDAAGAYQRLAATLSRVGEGSPPMFGKVMRHIGGRLVALMHEVSAGASASTDEDSASEPGALSRSKSHDILEATTASRGSVASDCERFSWRGSFESALLAADSRGTLGGGGCEARRSPAGVELAAQRSHSRSCGAISGSEDRLWRGRRRASAPDTEPEEEQRSGSLPRLPSVAGAMTVPSAGPVKSARYRAPGFRTATRAASAPGLHAPRRRRPAPPQPHLPPPAAPASAPSLQDDVFNSEGVPQGHATLPRRSNSPQPHDRDGDRDRFPINRSGLQARSESMASVYSGAGEGGRGTVAVKGEIQFSLLYNYRLSALEIGVRRCRDLAAVDVKKNRSDPYVKVYLLPDKSKSGKRKTKVKKNTLNPVFEETLTFTQPLASLSTRTLWLSVWHADMFGRNDFLGEATLPLTDVVFDNPGPLWYKLQERTEFDEQQSTKGDLIIGLKFEIQESSGNHSRAKGTLHVLVKEAKNLVATKPNGLSDVFCKSYLLPERGRLAKQKTSVSRRTLNPRWEHTFTYRGVTLHELSSRALELSLWDRDRLASNDFMGAVRLSLGTGKYIGASVNWMDSVGKEVTLWETMMQRPNFWVEGSLPLRPQLNN